jgi:signal transduction histidine kinase
MLGYYPSPVRAERLIAAGRLVLAAFSLLAIWFDPTEPSKYAEVTYVLLCVYLAYSLVVAVRVWRSPGPLARLPVVTHTVDLAVFSLFMYLTEGPTSPFFAYFVFSLLAATLRWQWRGTLWTALAALALFCGMGVYAAEVLRDPQFELNRFIIRSVYLAVVAVLLGYLGDYERRTRAEMSKLAAWSFGIPPESEILIRDVLEHAAGVLATRRLVMAWEEPEEPWLYLAAWDGAEVRLARESPEAFQPLVPEPLAGRSFLSPDARAPKPTVLLKGPSGVTRWDGPALHPAFRARFGVGPVLALGLRGENVTGHLFCLDKTAMTSDDFVLGEIVTRQVAARIDLFHMWRRLKQAAATEERLRLARDLHDGLLQSMTGIALLLHSVRYLMDEKAEDARERLAEVQRLIGIQQRELRAIIHQLKPAALDQAEANSDLPVRLQELAGWIERQWGARLTWRIEPRDARVPRSLAHDFHLIVQEAVVNAARHARASAVSVEVAIGSKGVRLIVADDGRGFEFQGRREHEALARLNLGPTSLRERITGLRGTLAIESSDRGARLEITLPLRPPEG